MKFTQKISSFITLVLLATTFVSHKTHAMEPEQPEATSFADLSPEMQYYFIQLISTTSNAMSLQEAGKTINALAQTNPELNQIINEPKFCLKLIKNLAQQFNCSDQEAAEALQTQAAKNRLFIQKQFLTLCKKENFNQQVFNDLYEQYKGYVDLNFTLYLFEFGSKFKLTLLSRGALDNNCPLIETLLSHGANINQTITSKGMTALGIATFNTNLSAVKCLLNNPNIVINQRGPKGYTVLLLAMIIEAEQPKKPNESLNLIVKLLLEAGADPEIASDDGLTPLQVARNTNNQEVIDLIQEAINKKYEKK
jgi:hypothetical protein